MLTTKQTLELLSVFAAFTSSMALYYASLGVSFDQQTWGGQSPKELWIRRRQRVMTWVGIPAAFVALIAQTIVILRY